MFFAMDGAAGGRTGSTRVGGEGSSGRGGHYVGGTSSSSSGGSSRSGYGGGTGSYGGGGGGDSSGEYSGWLNKPWTGPGFGNPDSPNAPISAAPRASGVVKAANTKKEKSGATAKRGPYYTPPAQPIIEGRR